MEVVCWILLTLDWLYLLQRHSYIGIWKRGFLWAGCEMLLICERCGQLINRVKMTKKTKRIKKRAKTLEISLIRYIIYFTWICSITVDTSNQMNNKQNLSISKKRFPEILLATPLFYQFCVTHPDLVCILLSFLVKMLLFCSCMYTFTFYLYCV